MENETDEVVSGVSTLAMAVERSGPLSFADICDLGAEVAGRLAEQHDEGQVHGHVAAGSVVRLDDGPWRLAPSSLVPDVEPVVAPELVPGADPTPAADVYALGAVLSFGLTGEPVDPATSGPAAAEPAEPAVDDDGDLELSADDLDRLASMGRGRPEADAATDPDPDPGDADADIDLTDEPDGSPMTLPEVMSSFLVVLRATLAADPVDRPGASSLAATLRQLRSDADVALGGALVGGASTVVIGDGVAGADAWGAPDVDAELPPPPDPTVAPSAAAAGPLTVDGTGATASLAAAGAKPATKKSVKDRLPVVVAAAAILVAAFLGVSLLRERGDQSGDLLTAGPTAGTVVRRTTTTGLPSLPVDIVVETTTTLATSTTTSTSTTVPVTTPETVPTTLAPETTLPTTTLPVTTLPPTTTTTRPPQVGIPVTVTCGTATVPCPARLYSEPSTLPPSTVVQQAVNGTTLSAQCAKDAEQVGDSKVWLRIIGQGSFSWIPKAAVSYSATVPPCSA